MCYNNQKGKNEGEIIKIEKYEIELLFQIKSTKNLSEKSIVVYQSDLTDYFAFIKMNKKCFLHHEIIYRYLNHLQNQKN